MIPVSLAPTKKQFDQRGGCLKLPKPKNPWGGLWCFQKVLMRIVASGAKLTAPDNYTYDLRQFTKTLQLTTNEPN
jgi:hypothetical protein